MPARKATTPAAIPPHYFTIAQVADALDWVFDGARPPVDDKRSIDQQNLSRLSLVGREPTASSYLFNRRSDAKVASQWRI
jgi:hypothetical protein